MKFLKLLKEGETLPQVEYNVICWNGEKVVIAEGAKPQPKNVVTYYAASKLTETTSTKNSGLHTNAFGATMVSHEFADGKGTITFDGDVTQFGVSAFQGCTSLTSVTIPNSVTSIKSSAFYSCSNLTSITIPDSVTSINIGAFQECTSLTSVTIGNGVTSIGNYAFTNCSKLTSVTIPDSVTSIGINAFINCYSLTSVTYNDTAYTSKSELTTALSNGGVTVGSGVFNGTALTD